MCFSGAGNEHARVIGRAASIKRLWRRWWQQQTQRPGQQISAIDNGK
jgi:hypothetical protein